MQKQHGTCNMEHGKAAEEEEINHRQRGRGEENIRPERTQQDNMKGSEGSETILNENTKNVIEGERLHTEKKNYERRKRT